MAFGIDTTDQDTQNLLAMLKRNGFTEEAELQKALEVLRPDKFKTNNNIGEEPLAALVAPPVDATNNAIAHAPIAPQLPTDHQQLDGGVIAPHGVRPV
uniref:Uncharacterized protein n=1 Tax=Ditylenchus dipsaci TaxID=166011 RepID=A0A915E4B8_9BILA